jgi:hypothetical protein
LVNGIGVSIHHIINWLWICPVAFIFDERGRGMVNPWCVAASRACASVPGVNPLLNRITLKLASGEVGEEFHAGSSQAFSD